MLKPKCSSIQKLTQPKTKMATVTITERGTTNVPPAVTIVRVQEFLRTPFPGFGVVRLPQRPKDFRITVDREQALFIPSEDVYTTQIDRLSLHFENHLPSCFVVQTEEELDRLAQMLFSKPVYVMARCKVQVGEQYEWNTRIRQFVATDFVVRLETETDTVRSQLATLFEKARRCIQRGKLFYTKIDMNQVIRTWFERNASRRIFVGTSSASGAQFGVSNGSKPCCNGGCTNCAENPGACLCMTVFCLPIALLCCLPYCIYRKILYKDKTHYIAGEVKIGFNVTISANELLDLLARYERTRMQEEHERLYGPLGSQPPPYTPAGPSGHSSRRTGSTTSAAPAYSSRPGSFSTAPVVEEPPPYEESDPICTDERLPILANV
eukprot:m.250995 g.250995  ORF g.250995 m.250995 type:complete len:380 (+) comp40328_c2_seq36:234-1373(+)